MAEHVFQYFGCLDTFFKHLLRSNSPSSLPAASAQPYSGDPFLKIRSARLPMAFLVNATAQYQNILLIRQQLFKSI
jgi:hypothetical protein